MSAVMRLVALTGSARVASDREKEGDRADGFAGARGGVTDRGCGDRRLIAACSAEEMRLRHPEEKRQRTMTEKSTQSFGSSVASENSAKSETVLIENGVS
jgi:hypothetical protein